jgi:hypothetical protein
VRVIGGADNPAPTITSAGTFEDLGRIFAANSGMELFYGGYYLSALLPLQINGSLCSRSNYRLQPPYLANKSIETSLAYDDCTLTGSGGLALNVWSFNDRITIKPTTRRRAIDGSEYEAVPIVIEREGLPWITYYAGYRMGVIAAESDWIIGNETRSDRFLSGNNPPATTRIMWPRFPDPRSNFELVKLPPPFAEGEVVEYAYGSDEPSNPYVRPLSNYFFYSASTAEQSLLDESGVWWRTGYSFKSGGYVSVCRLFGGAALKAHVLGAGERECAALRDTPGYADEGLPFRASTLIPASASSPTLTCPTGSKPLYRAVDVRTGNSRYATSRLLIEQVVSQAGWGDRGAVMCVPE